LLHFRELVLCPNKNGDSYKITNQKRTNKDLESVALLCFLNLYWFGV